MLLQTYQLHKVRIIMKLKFPKKVCQLTRLFEWIPLVDDLLVHFSKFAWVFFISLHFVSLYHPSPVLYLILFSKYFVCSIWILERKSEKKKFLLFIYWPCLSHVEVPMPGIKPVPQQWPKPLQWQNQIFNLLHHKRTQHKCIFNAHTIH